MPSSEAALLKRSERGKRIYEAISDRFRGGDVLSDLRKLRDDDSRRGMLIKSEFIYRSDVKDERIMLARRDRSIFLETRTYYGSLDDSRPR